MFEVLEKGGVMMIPILFSSVIALAVIVDRLLATSRVKLARDSQIKELFNCVARDEEAQFMEAFNNSHAPIFKVMNAILESKGDESAAEKAAGLSGDKILRVLNRRLEWLAILGSLVPLMGLLGTVIGMIKVFSDVAAAGDVSDITLLAGGIWEALLTTAAGMAVAIPILLVYHAFQSKIDNIAFEMRQRSEELIVLLRKCGRL